MREVLEIDKEQELEIKRGKINTSQGWIRLRDIPLVKIKQREYNLISKSYLSYIKQVFTSSGVIVEYPIQIEGLAERLEELDGYIKFVVLDEVTENNLRQLSRCKENIDRVIIKDKGTLCLSELNKASERVSEVLGCNPKEVGVCNSPYSYYGRACLTALTARKLLSQVQTDGRCGTPSQLDETGDCGCLHSIHL